MYVGHARFRRSKFSCRHRLRGCLSQENKTPHKGASSPGRTGALQGMTNVVEAADSPASLPAQV